MNKRMLVLIVLGIVGGVMLNQVANYVTQKGIDRQNRHNARMVVETIEHEQLTNPDESLSAEHIKAAVEIQLTKGEIINPFFADREISVSVDTEPPKDEIPGDIRIISRTDGRYTVIAYGDKHCPTVYDLTGE